MAAALRAGFVYFAIVFATGFVLGAVRVLLLAPALGAFLAVLIELPVMLSVAWVACGRLVARFAVPAWLAPRLAMGGFAFACLMVAEAVLGLALGRSAADLAASYGTPEGVLGLAGQVAFALFPAIRGR